MSNRPAQVALFLVVVLCVCCSTVRSLSLFDHVHRFHRTLETLDMGKIGDVYNREATVFFLGQELFQRHTITDTVGRLFLSKLTHLKILVLSPIYDTPFMLVAKPAAGETTKFTPKNAASSLPEMVANNVTTHAAHYFAHYHVMGPRQCVAVIHAFEQLRFDDNGLVIYHKVEWQDTIEKLEALLTCSDPSEDLEQGNDEEPLHVEKIFGSYAAFDKLNVKAYMEYWDSKYPNLINGDVVSFIGPKLSSLFADIFSKILRAYSSPAGPVIVRKRTSIHASTWFFVSKNGCSHAFDLVNYLLHSDTGSVLRWELYIVNRTLPEVLEEIGRCHHGMLLDAGSTLRHDEL